MRKNYGNRPLCYPQPVFVISTYNEDESINAMAAAWGGISEEDELSICISAGHKTTENILRNKAYCVSMATADYAKECDWFGCASGNDTADKFTRTGMTVSRSQFVNAPVINELPVCLEIELIDYNSDSCILRGKIRNVSVDESCLKDGKPDVSKIRPLTFDPFNGTYNVIAEAVYSSFSTKEY